MSVLATGGAALAHLQFLADDTDVGDETHKAGPLAVIVIIALCIACFVLFRSMTTHMRRVREQFPSDDPLVSDAAAPVDAPAGSSAPRTTAGTSRPTPKSRAHTPDA